jgi:hypothetical protein
MRASSRSIASLVWIAWVAGCHSAGSTNPGGDGVDMSAGTGGGGGSGGGGGGSGGGSGGGPDLGVTGNGPPQVTMFNSNCLSVPDPDVAASENLVGTAIQWTAYFYKKDGTPDHTYTWKALQGNLISDTHIVYDKSSKRWFLTTIVDLGNNKFGVQVMVSTDATATAWKTSIPATQTGLIDNPQPTVTSDKVVLVFHGNCLWAVDKQTLYAGNAAEVPTSACNLQSDDNVVAVKYGGDPPSTGYAVTMIDSTHISWVSVDGTQATGNVKVQQHSIAIPNVDEMDIFGGVTQNGMDIEAGKVKAMWQNDHLVWAQTIKCPTGACERIFDINTATNTATSHDFSLANTQLWFGVPGLDRFGNTWVVMAEAAKNGNVGLALAGIYASGKTYDPKIIVPGESVLTGGNRFGDYFSSAQDPVDGSTWLIGQYAGMPNSPLNTENSAGCKVVHVTAQ